MPRKRTMTFNLGGVRHTLRYAQLKHHHGDCDHLKHEIRIARSDNQFDELETVCHELLHGLDPKWREWWVERSACEIAAVLWRLGYRKTDDREI